jgi:hypothetical protein
MVATITPSFAPVPVGELASDTPWILSMCPVTPACPAVGHDANGVLDSPRRELVFQRFDPPRLADSQRQRSSDAGRTRWDLDRQIGPNTKTAPMMEA